MGSPFAQVSLDMDAFRPLGFRGSGDGHWPWWQRWLVILRGIRRSCICRMCQSKNRGGGKIWSGVRGEVILRPMTNVEKNFSEPGASLELGWHSTGTEMQGLGPGCPSQFRSE